MSKTSCMRWCARTFAKTSAERFTAQHGLAITTIDLPTVPFWKLLAQNGFTRVDLMSVDVEGDEEAVIRSIDFRRVDIRVLVVERPSEQLVAFLLAAGFVERTGEIVKPIATGQGLGDRVFLGAREAQEVEMELGAGEGGGNSILGQFLGQMQAAVKDSSEEAAEDDEER